MALSITGPSYRCPSTIPLREKQHTEALGRGQGYHCCQLGTAFGANLGGRPTPAECTMHLGAPVVPEENTMKRGWLKGSCSNSSWGACSRVPQARKSSRNMLWAETWGKTVNVPDAGLQPPIPPQLDLAHPPLHFHQDKSLNSHKFKPMEGKELSN
jgi:hypothetical protein